MRLTFFYIAFSLHSVFTLRSLPLFPRFFFQSDFVCESVEDDTLVRVPSFLQPYLIELSVFAQYSTAL